MKELYKTMTLTRKNYVIMSYDEEKDTYTVSYKLWDNSESREYTHYNRACWAFQSIHDTFKTAFKSNILTNLK